MREIKKVNIMDKFSLFDEKWTPKIVGELNDQYVKLCKLKDNFIWHSHEHEDELFMVFKGTLYIDFRDNKSIEINEGEMLIVPKGVEHRPRTNGELVLNLLFEPKTTKHTGQLDSDLTVKKLDWI
ncbi:MAG: mannose-6-phosphate isomerase [Flavobacteriales bacterium]|nr:mannose-6-phosphate isomerase [Flavobacteriales bacterium]|tara:strand:- start:1092 stop:1466 length:375 start_codon:yes stop_codon:yes gene_type:complete